MTKFGEEEARKVVRGEDRLLGIDELVERLGISRSTLNRWVKNPKTKNNINSFSKNFSINSFEINPFPEPVTYLGSSPRWLESSIVKWLIHRGHKGK